jgi:hypothetical protein
MNLDNGGSAVNENAEHADFKEARSLHELKWSVFDRLRLSPSFYVAFRDNKSTKEVEAL